MTIKGIIQNMIEMEATRFAEKRSGKFFNVVEGSFHFTNGNKDREPIFDVTIRQVCGWHEYRLSGYVSDYGDVSICSAEMEPSRVNHYCYVKLKKAGAI